ncbi:MAG: TIGR01777 family protein [Deltaproteobacteria bacterium]|nr:TIGR01777 family protein [Deltaproteobacteria bacterium]HCH63935.1 TIGR01777 family protein [Deltaproteobacteria bacterium]
MKVVIPGGSGQVGQVLRRALEAKGHNVVVLSRSGSERGPVRHWDGRTLGAWAQEIDGSDVVINLAGRTVNCRYTEENLTQMMDSRVESTRVVGEAIAHAAQPPTVWLQMSTATIYAHTLGPAHTEAHGVIGGQEPDVPAYWKRSIDIATAWEAELEAAHTPHTRKVALRSAMVMSVDRGGVFDVLAGLTRLGLGGPIGGGHQYVSWIHEHDLVSAVMFLIARDDLRGAFNLASPGPLPQRDFQTHLRSGLGVWLGLPATRWMAELGAVFLRTDTELVLKSRRVVPGRLLDAGFEFQFADWPAAAEDLVKRWRHAA